MHYPSPPIRSQEIIGVRGGYCTDMHLLISNANHYHVVLILGVNNLYFQVHYFGVILTLRTIIIVLACLHVNVYQMLNQCVYINKCSTIEGVATSLLIDGWICAHTTDPIKQLKVKVEIRWKVGYLLHIIGNVTMKPSSKLYQILPEEAYDMFTIIPKLHSTTSSK